EMAAVGVAPRLGVHLVHERARRVDDPQATHLRVLLHRRRDAVGRENADRTGWDLVLGLDEDRAELLQAAEDVVVVDDRVADVDRRAVLLEQPLDDLDRPVHTGAERARRGKKDAASHHMSLLATSGTRYRPCLNETRLMSPPPLRALAGRAVRRASSAPRLRGGSRPSGATLPR